MKIVVGYRGKDTEKALLELAVKHAKAFDGIVFLITSMRGGKEVESEEFARAEEKLEKGKVFLEKNGVKNETHLIVEGLAPGEDLVNYSKKINADVIFIGAKSRSKVRKLLFGSTTQYVILEASCPVLYVK